ncbi:MAG: sulfatase-like hydrolase/transferase [Verrucomicrobia bacterium]|nr:sulfatase-like hydrolase/transferase [Verrucomicrobiota bacterium]
MADDFGVGNIRAHHPANATSTPFLDQLVQQRMSLSHAHAASGACTRSRYGLPTGRYTWRTRFLGHALVLYGARIIQRECATCFLKEHGYHAVCVGKRYVGRKWPVPQANRGVSRADERHGQMSLTRNFTRRLGGEPTQRGFDEYFGVDALNYFRVAFIENVAVVVQPNVWYDYASSEGGARFTSHAC